MVEPGLEYSSLPSSEQSLPQDTSNCLSEPT